MKKTAVLILCVYLAPLILEAHENWILLKTKGSRIEASICSGHDFPESSFILPKKIFTYLYIITPSGKKVQLDSEKGPNNTRRAVWNAGENGSYTFAAALKNPPRYFLKSHIDIGAPSDLAPTAQVLEIIAVQKLSALKKGGRVKLQLNYHGKPVRGEITVTASPGTGFSSFTDRVGSFSLHLRYRAAYCITARHKGKTATLTFTTN